MTTAILSIFGVIIGASLQYVFTRYLENQRHRRELRTQAYLDYLNSVNGLAHPNEPQGSQQRDLFAKAADAKQRAAFVAMVAAMRKDSGNTAGPGIEDMDTVLLGSRD
ncbi:MAG: hypothetical protein LAO24_09380 [Acidobacteriia bacterium]|nr:hypothetical protein [Terriglobia bacterium]